jgi:hypothetical protein
VTRTSISLVQVISILVSDGTDEVLLCLPCMPRLVFVGSTSSGAGTRLTRVTLYRSRTAKQELLRRREPEAGLIRTLHSSPLVCGVRPGSITVHWLRIDLPLWVLPNLSVAYVGTGKFTDVVPGIEIETLQWCGARVSVLLARSDEGYARLLQGEIHVKCEERGKRSDCYSTGKYDPR